MRARFREQMKNNLPLVVSGVLYNDKSCHIDLAS